MESCTFLLSDFNWEATYSLTSGLGLPKAHPHPGGRCQGPLPKVFAPTPGLQPLPQDPSCCHQEGPGPCFARAELGSSRPHAAGRLAAPLGQPPISALTLKTHRAERTGMDLGPKLRPSTAPSSPSAGGPLVPAGMPLVHEQEEHQLGDGAFPPHPMHPVSSSWGLAAHSSQSTQRRQREQKQDTNNV